LPKSSVEPQKRFQLSKASELHFSNPSAILNDMEILAKSIQQEIIIHDPVDLLQSFWLQFWEAISTDSEKSNPDPTGQYQFALEYLHAVLASTPPPEPLPSQLTTEKSSQVLGLLEELRTITLRYCMAQCLSSREEPFGSASADVKFRAYSTWVSIRGNRYQALEGEFFRYVLQPHNSELKQQHGHSAHEISQGIQSAVDSMRFSLARAITQISECLRQSDELSKKEKLSIEEATAQLLHSDHSFRDSLTDATLTIQRAAFCNLSRSSTLPETILHDLSYERGGNSEFFEEGAYCGTPLRTLPARLRPLIKIGREYYAIDGQFLRDSAYRAIQRGLLTRNPGYRQEWNERQKLLAEKAFIEVFDRQLAGSFIATEVFYPDPETGNWVETDLVIITDDTLIVLEAKAGATAMHNPATDLHRHVRAIQGLVLDAYRQCNRFIRYLNSKSSAPIFSHSKSGFRELRQIRISYFNLILPIGLTIENFSPFSAMCKELPGYGPIDGKHPFVSMSIDDLLVLRQFLPTTGRLFHYLEVRQAVAGVAGAQLFDEIDHLGAYLRQNRADQTMLEQLKSADYVWWDGFSDVIDEYFGNPDWQNLAVPEQPYPETVAELLEALDSQRPPGFLNANRIIRNLNSASRANLDNLLTRLTGGGHKRPIMAVLSGNGAKPIQFWGLPDIRFSRIPDIEERAQVACLAAKVKSMPIVFFEVNSYGRIGRICIRQARAPSPIELSYPRLLASALKMEDRRIKLGKHDRKKR
jgi:hypothetical protein